MPGRVLAVVVAVVLSVLAAPVVGAAGLGMGAPGLAVTSSGGDTFLSPANGASNVDTTKAFTWSSVAASQGSILVVGTKQFGTNLVNSGVLPAGQMSYQVPALPAGVTLYATLLTKLAGAWSQFEAIVFTAAPGSDTFTSPANGQSLVDTAKPFTWSSIPASEGAILVVGTKPYGTDLVNSGVLPATQTSYAVPVLPGGKELYATLLTETDGAWTRFQALSFSAAAATPHGVFDTSFGTNGAVTSTNSSPDSLALVAATGETLVGLVSPVGNGTLQGYVTRLSASGQVDSTFGTAGTVTLPAGMGVSQVLDAGGGKVLVLGIPPTAGNQATSAEMTRLTSTGALDPTFGTGGIVTLAPQPAYSQRPQATVGAGGEIYVAATVATGASTEELAVHAYTAAGAVDATFGNAGAATTTEGGQANGSAVTVEPNGDVVVAGDIELLGATTSETLVARFLPSGLPDASFGTGGAFVAQLGGNNGGASQVVVDPDGHLVIGGSAFGAGGQMAMLARLTPAGILDSSFGTSGVVVEHPAGDIDAFVGVGLGANGDLYGVMMQQDGPFNASLWRFTPSGTPDTSFGAAGVVALPGLIPTAFTIGTESRPEVGMEVPPTSDSVVARFTS